MTELMHTDSDTGVADSAAHRPSIHRYTGHQHSGSALYTAAQLRDVPPAAISASTAVGNPIAVAAPRSGHTVVDLGGGAGLDAIVASRLVGEDGRVYLIDDNPLAVSMARRNARHAGARNITCVHADLDSVPVPPASADVVISNHALSYAAGKAAILRHAHRILGPAGILACALLARAGADCTTPCPRALLSVPQVERLFVDAGFSHPVTAAHRALTGDLVAVTLVAHAVVSPAHPTTPVW